MPEYEAVCTSEKMALFCYFKSNADTNLPDHLGPLSKTVPSTDIASANGEAKHVFEAQQAMQPTKRDKQGSQSIHENFFCKMFVEAGQSVK